MIKPLLFKKRAPRTASDQDIAALEARIGVKLPEALIEFCSKWNGGFCQAENEYYPVPLFFSEFFAEYPRSTGLFVPILFGATEEFWQCSLLAEMVSLNADSDLWIIPIAADLMGNHVVILKDSPDRMVFWQDQELWEHDPSAEGPHYPTRPRLIPIATDLESFYNGLTVDPDK